MGYLGSITLDKQKSSWWSSPGGFLFVQIYHQEDFCLSRNTTGRIFVCPQTKYLYSPYLTSFLKLLNIIQFINVDWKLASLLVWNLRMIFLGSQDYGTGYANHSFIQLLRTRALRALVLCNCIFSRKLKNQKWVLPTTSSYSYGQDECP